jgi:hypothetical protein
VVVELKAGKFRHEYAGRLAFFYVTMVDDQLRNPEWHTPTVGILLCSSKTEGVVRYALRAANAPMASPPPPTTPCPWPRNQHFHQRK